MAAEKVQARIEQAPRQTTEPARAAQPDAQASAAPVTTDGATCDKAPQRGACARFSSWFSSAFPHSRNAVIGGVCGLVVALLLFTIGLFKTLVIAVLVTIGVACGQYADGDPKLVNLVRELMKRR